MSDATLSPVSLIVNVFNHLNQLNFHFNSCNPNNSSADVDGFIPGTASRTDTPSHSIMILAHARESYSSASGKRTLGTSVVNALCPGRYFGMWRYDVVCLMWFGCRAIIRLRISNAPQNTTKYFEWSSLNKLAEEVVGRFFRDFLLSASQCYTIDIL